MPTTKKAMRAKTLIRAAQNSSSPNHSTEIRFIDSTTIRASSANTHWGIDSKVVHRRR